LINRSDHAAAARELDMIDSGTALVWRGAAIGS
jgi:hypothetical protein